MGLISRVSSRTYRLIMAENHPFLEMLTGMGFERQKCINVMNRVGLDANIEQLIIELTSEPDVPQNTKPEKSEKPQNSEKTESSENQTTSTSSTAAAAAQNRAANPQPGQLTAEERAKRNAEIDARANAARLVRIEREKQEKNDREKLRRSEGRKMMDVANDLDDQEIKRAKQRVDDEKREAAEARRKIKEQIEADRQARMNKNKKVESPAKSSSSAIST